MNIKLKIFIFLLIVILLLFFIRVIIYNNYINRLSQVRENFVSNNSDKMALDLNTLNTNTPNNLLNILKGPALIYSTILGEIIVINNSNVLILKDKKINQLDLKSFFGEDYNVNRHRGTFSGGYYNYKNNTLNIFLEDKLVCFSLADKKTLLEEQKTSYLGKKNIENAIVFFNKLVLLDNENSVFIINLYTNNEEEQADEKKFFNTLPQKISSCFINFCDIQKGIPIGTPTFINDGDIYTLDLAEKKLMGPRRIEDGFSNNVEISMVNSSKKVFNVVDSGLYRIFSFGAGLQNAGLGGLVFNDIYLKKKDKLSLICGESGERIPVKSQGENSLSKIYSIKLPFNGSCSGSGATVFSVNDEIKLISGGGGGWSSELVVPPKFCHSQKLELRAQNKFNEKIKKIVPIKKIIISTPGSNNNTRHRILVTGFDISVFNSENTKMDVNQVPPIENINKKFLYETDYSKIGDESQIQFTFENSITDYKIKLDYTIDSTSDEEFANSKVIIVDEQYRKYIIDNFNFTFNYKYITGETICKFIHPNGENKNNIDNLNFVTNGYSIKENLDNISSEELDYFKFEDNIGDLEGENRYILLKGGLGGGAHCYSDRKSNMIIAGGGGGYLGGKSMINENTIEYSGGQGGTSFVKDPNFKGEWLDVCEEAFVNSVNNKNGFLILQKIKKRIAQNEYKITAKNRENNVNDNSNSNIYNRLNSNTNFFNKNVEKFFSKKGSELDKQRVITPLNSLANSSRFNLNIEELQNADENILIETNVNSLKFDRICLALSSSLPFSIMFIGWNKTEYSRFLIDIKSDEFQEDDISQLNHGLEKLDKTDLEKYLREITSNNIYRHTGNVNDLDTYKYKLTSMKNFVFYSKPKNNINMFNEVIKIKPEYDRIFILVNFDEKSDKKIKYVLNKFNSKTDNPRDIKNRTKFYL